MKTGTPLFTRSLQDKANSRVPLRSDTVLLSLSVGIYPPPTHTHTHKHPPRVVFAQILTKTVQLYFLTTYVCMFQKLFVLHWWSYNCEWRRCVCYCFRDLFNGILNWRVCVGMRLQTNNSIRKTTRHKGVVFLEDYHLRDLRICMLDPKRACLIRYHEILSFYHRSHSPRHGLN